MKVFISYASTHPRESRCARQVFLLLKRWGVDVQVQAMRSQRMTHLEDAQQSPPRLSDARFVGAGAGEQGRLRTIRVVSGDVTPLACSGGGGEVDDRDITIIVGALPGAFCIEGGRRSTRAELSWCDADRNPAAADFGVALRRRLHNSAVTIWSASEENNAKFLRRALDISEKADDPNKRIFEKQSIRGWRSLSIFGPGARDSWIDLGIEDGALTYWEGQSLLRKQHSMTGDRTFCGFGGPFSGKSRFNALKRGGDGVAIFDVAHAGGSLALYCANRTTERAQAGAQRRPSFLHPFADIQMSQPDPGDPGIAIAPNRGRITALFGAELGLARRRQQETGLSSLRYWRGFDGDLVDGAFAQAQGALLRPQPAGGAKDLTSASGLSGTTVKSAPDAEIRRIAIVHRASEPRRDGGVARRRDGDPLSRLHLRLIEGGGPDSFAAFRSSAVRNLVAAPSRRGAPSLAEFLESLGQWFGFRGHEEREVGAANAGNFSQWLRYALAQPSSVGGAKRALSALEQHFEAPLDNRGRASPKQPFLVLVIENGEAKWRLAGGGPSAAAKIVAIHPTPAPRRDHDAGPDTAPD